MLQTLQAYKTRRRHSHGVCAAYLREAEALVKSLQSALETAALFKANADTGRMIVLIHKEVLRTERYLRETQATMTMNDNDIMPMDAELSPAFLAALEAVAAL